MNKIKNTKDLIKEKTMLAFCYFI